MTATVKKTCSICKKAKATRNYYQSTSPIFSLDGLVPICKSCVLNGVVNSNGSINNDRFKEMMRKVDKPLYYNVLYSAKVEVSKINNATVAEIECLGKEIVQRYMKNIGSLPQFKFKDFSESERDGFMSTSSLDDIGVNGQGNEMRVNRNDTLNFVKENFVSEVQDINMLNAVQEEQENDETYEEENNETKEDKIRNARNKQYVISTVGYDPFSNISLSEKAKNYCYNVMSGYCNMDGIRDDENKMQSVIEVVIMFSQSRRITQNINIELSKPIVNEKKIASYTSSKKTLMDTVSTLLKDNNISSNYNKNVSQGKGSLTQKMKDMENDGFEAIKVNMFDIKTSEAFKQIQDISNSNIMAQLALSDNEYTQIISDQREMIQSMRSQNDELKEENRLLKNRIIYLESQNGGAS